MTMSTEKAALFEETVQNAREAALAILQPSAKDRDHGLELHRHSLVVESYGLGWSAPMDSVALNRRNEEGASDLEYLDLGGDMAMTAWGLDRELREEFRAIWNAAGVSSSFLNSGEEGNDPMRMLKRLARRIFLIDAFPDFLQKITSGEDILSAHKMGKRGICLTTNGVPLSGNQISPEDELRFLSVFAELGVRMMHLTYNRRNPIGDGCGEMSNGGLSDFGHTVIGEMNRLGVLIDLAHTGWQTCLDAAKASQQPVVVSHSAAWALQPHYRCKTDEVIRAVVDTGGTIGLVNVPKFVGGAGNIAAFLDQIDYVAQKFGVDAVTIGTDCSYPSVQCADANQRMTPRGKRRKGWEGLWPEIELPVDPKSLEPDQVLSLRAWTNWPLFTVGLVQRGYSDEQIQKIIGGNMLRVATQTWTRSAYAVPSKIK